MPDKSASFDVVSITIADYATQDAGGNGVHVGVRVGDLYVASTPPTFPAWFAVLVLRPKQQNFNFSLDVIAPNRKEMLRINCDCIADRVPNQETHLTSAIQFPAIPFPGFGDYVIRVKDGAGAVVHRHILTFKLGVPDLPIMNVNATATVNPEFTRPPAFETGAP
jgi:hypothetical protein